MKIKKFPSYEKYKKCQIKYNKKKIDKVSVVKKNILKASEFLLKYNRNANNVMDFGLCHGTRNGHEQRWFREFLGIDVLGTEISDTAKDYPNTVQWDFHNVKKEWVNSCDFIFSNSLDHSYDPSMCLKQWGKCLKEGSGLIVLEVGRFHGEAHVRGPDCFGATFDEHKIMFRSLGFDIINVIKVKGNRLIFAKFK